MKPTETTSHEGKGIPFYRCTTCHRPVSNWDVNNGGCAYCGQTRFKPTNLTFWEGIKEIIRNPRILKYIGHE